MMIPGRAVKMDTFAFLALLAARSISILETQA